MDPTELEFLAEDELISIVPRVRMEEVYLLDSQVLNYFFSAITFPWIYSLKQDIHLNLQGFLRFLVSNAFLIALIDHN